MKEITFKERVKQGINDLFYIWLREFRTTFRDQGVLIFFILVPLVYPLIYGFIYTNEVVREVPAVVVDASRSSLSREYLRKVDATPDINIVAYCADMEEAKLMLKDRLAYGIIYIPSEFSQDIAQGKQTQVSIYCDMSGLLYYKSMLLANTAVSLDMNRDIKIERAGNTTARQDEITGYPIEYEDVAMFNPTNGFAAFLIPAVLILLIQQTLLLGIAFRQDSARTESFQRPCTYQPALQRYVAYCHGKGFELLHGLFAGIGICTMCRPSDFQSEPNRTAGHARPVHATLSGSLHLFCHDRFHCYPQPGNVYAAIRVYLRPSAVHLGNILAGCCYPSVLEILFLRLPIDFRHQWFCTHQ